MPLELKPSSTIAMNDSDDLLEGRGPASRGDRLTQLYIATQMEAHGLEPAAPGGGAWRLVFDTAVDEGATQEIAVAGPYTLDAQAAAVFRTG